MVDILICIWVDNLNIWFGRSDMLVNGKVDGSSIYYGGVDVLKAR